MMDLPLEDLLEDLPLSDELKSALMIRDGIYGQALNCVTAMEANDYSGIEFMDIGLKELSEIYLNAIFWADQQLRTVVR